MAKTHVMLAKDLDWDKIEYPCIVSEKLDGVACSFQWRGKHLVEKSRPGKRLPSVDMLRYVMKHSGKLHHEAMVVGEAYVPGMRFAQANGILRRQHPNGAIRFGIYDYVASPNDDRPYSVRINEALKIWGYKGSIHVITMYPCMKAEMIHVAKKIIYELNPDAEGIVIRSSSHQFQPNKRSWGMMRLVPKPTHDLKVVGFEEAVDKHKKPKGMVGRITVLYKGNETGSGAGKLTHKDRKYIWEHQDEFIGKIACIQYKPDPSYEKGLRQPTFQYWRDDKTEPNED